MKPPLPLSALCSPADYGPAIGPVAGHRIAQIRRRIHGGRYALDSVALAKEIVCFDGSAPLGCGPTALAVQHLLALALDRLDHRAALVLQLEFVEQLAAREIAATIGTTAEELATVRSAALMQLKALLESGADYR